MSLLAEDKVDEVRLTTGVLQSGVELWKPRRVFQELGGAVESDGVVHGVGLRLTEGATHPNTDHKAHCEWSEHLSDTR